MNNENEFTVKSTINYKSSFYSKKNEKYSKTCKRKILFVVHVNKINKKIQVRHATTNCVCSEFIIIVVKLSRFNVLLSKSKSTSISLFVSFLLDAICTLTHLTLKNVYSALLKLQFS